MFGTHLVCQICFNKICLHRFQINNVGAGLPSSLSNLQELHLILLNLSENEFSGQIPSSLFDNKFSALQTLLCLSSNNLSGCQLKSLKLLFLSQNNELLLNFNYSVNLNFYPLKIFGLGFFQFD